jgi:hypothetical protein
MIFERHIVLCITTAYNSVFTIYYSCLLKFLIDYMFQPYKAIFRSKFTELITSTSLLFITAAPTLANVYSWVEVEVLSSTVVPIKVKIMCNMRD